MNIEKILENIKKKNFSKALSGIEKLLIENPNLEQNVNLKGVILANLDQVIEARKCWFNAIKINNSYFDPIYNLGDSYLKKREYDEALKYFIKASELQPKNFIVHFRIGYLFMQKQKWDKALFYFSKSKELNNKFPKTFFNMAIILNLLNKKKESILFFKSYIELQPNDIEAYYSLGICYREVGDIQMAEKIFSKALKINPEYPYLKGQLQFMKNHLCDWSNYNLTKKDIEKDIAKNKKTITPWQALSVIESPKLLKDNTILFIDNKEFNNKDLIEKKKITLGYFSPDFCEHAVSNQFKQILRLHDKKKFEIIGFYLNSKQDKKLYEIKDYFDKFFNINQMSTEDIIRLTEAQKVDIAIDLAGYTYANRYQVFNQRCAPIQVSYLGFAGSTGLNNMDYLIADKTVIPDDCRKFYSENIIYMPNTFMPADDTQKISKENLKRKDFGIPNNAVVYCCFNKSYKITPNIFNIWIDIINEVKNSVLWLNISNDQTKLNIIDYAKKNNLNPNKIFFTNRSRKYEDYLEKHSLADIFLDTYPFSAHSTGYASLISGVPIVTYKSDTFANNVCSSLLFEAELQELITKNLSDYKSLAIELGRNKKRLDSIKNKLKENFIKKKIFNSGLYVLNLEKAFYKIYQLKKNHKECSDLNLD
ncbi:tetratricopeptide repeat protein [Candidatus Pelagibacter sp.]|nr:tetratricopeptide repeat protein [Candidatus Pelagibacter sp.]